MISPSASVELLHTISRQLNTSLNLDEVMGRVLQLTVEATGATCGSLFLLNEHGAAARYILARPDQPPEISRRNVDKVMHDGLAGWVYRQQRGMIVPNTALAENWVKLPDDTTATNSALGVPLLHQDRINGILILHHTEVSFFDETHLSLVTGIAGQAAIAIENARLFTRLKNEHATLYSLITGMPIPVLVINSEGLILLASQAARQLLLLDQEQIPLQALEGGHKIELALHTLRQDPQRRSVEVQWSDKQIFSLSVNQVAQLGTVVTFHDISELKELDEMKSIFVETVSHDLKNPLSTIHGYATLLGIENLSKRGRANLEGLLQGVERIQTLIQDLLDLSRIESGVDEQIELCDMIEIVEEVITNFKLAMAEKEITLTRDIPAEMLHVSGNSLRLSQIAANFISNAVKYTPKGGKVFVGLSKIASQIRLYVSDNGPGIPAAEQSKIFEKFYRVPIMENGEWIEGTGLGLSIVKAIVEGYGGQIWLDSEVGVGSTFGCILPAVEVSPPTI
ncbi:MAG: GAF domain-containing sensor histidine kinase [Anaerolineae bacterium]